MVLYHQVHDIVEGFAELYFGTLVIGEMYLSSLVSGHFLGVSG